uniref:GDSL esterase/lipase At5g03610-like n=1 Tax=Nelumbo nucifera TaxID=4432 RepID=A0A822Y8G7_NELNU|nr:TPA_asm: hypothetical protein HUJ06_030258 [Nelumbo nucifera]
MAKEIFHLLLFFFLLTGIQVVESSSHNHHHHRHRYHIKLNSSKLFVFGDSYVDTGNNPVSESRSWHKPYGLTFPGKPAGRWSDGRVFTDYFASVIGIKSPIPYKWIKVKPELIKYGINFAYGGTGVFDTLSTDPNMTIQINFLQNFIQEGVYSNLDLNSSIALVSAAGNDYSAYLSRNGTLEGLPALIISVVNQLASNLKRIHSLGVKNVVVNGLQPIGCAPYITASSSSRQKCNETVNILVKLHNLLLNQAVNKLNSETNGSTYKIINLYSAFTTVLNNTGNQTFTNPLQQCCKGKNSTYTCGNTENGVEMYTVCENREAAFFWDDVHPTQQGWSAVFSALQASLHQLYSSLMH